MQFSPGDVVDSRYTVQSVLGEGGFGETYRALDAQTGQVVVIKMPHPAVIGDLSSYNRYRREVDIGERLDHPGVQHVLSVDGTSSGHKPYMVLEYIDGQSLRSYMRARGPLPVDEVLRIGGQLTRTLGYIHAQGIVHRDLKPENILISPDGTLTLVDFGIALRTGARRLTFNHLTNAVGTPDYMAPEQVRGERGDVRTDVYALGVLLYELLVGKVPYPAHDALEAMRRKVETDPPLVRRLRSDVPPPLEAVIYRALRRTPAERYQSVAELEHDLEHLDDVTIPVYRRDIPPPTPLGDLPPWRMTALILLVIFGVLAAVAVLAEVAHRGVATH
jgi:serine/threonine-protein kinase